MLERLFGLIDKRIIFEVRTSFAPDAKVHDANVVLVRQAHHIVVCLDDAACRSLRRRLVTEDLDGNYLCVMGYPCDANPVICHGPDDACHMGPMIDVRKVWRDISNIGLAHRRRIRVVGTTRNHVGRKVLVTQIEAIVKDGDSDLAVALRD